MRSGSGRSRIGPLEDHANYNNSGNWVNLSDVQTGPTGHDESGATREEAFILAGELKDLSRFKKEVRWLKWERIKHSYKKTPNLFNSFTVSSGMGVCYGLISALQASITGEFPVSNFILATSGTAVSLGSGIVLNKKYKERYSSVRSFSSQDLIGLEDEFLESIYSKKSERSNSHDYGHNFREISESLVKSCQSEGNFSKENILTKMNSLFLDEVPQSCYHMKNAFDETDKIVCRRMSHETDDRQYIDQIRDLKVMQFHVYSHIMGYLQQCSDKSLAGLPNNFAHIQEDIKDIYCDFSGKFLQSKCNEANNFGISSDDFYNKAREGLNKISQFVDIGKFSSEGAFNYDVEASNLTSVVSNLQRISNNRAAGISFEDTLSIATSNSNSEIEEKSDEDRPLTPPSVTSNRLGVNNSGHSLVSQNDGARRGSAFTT